MANLFEGSWYEEWKLSWTGFADDTQCPVCKGFAMTDENIDKIVETSGGNETRARMRYAAGKCKCTPGFQVTPKPPRQQSLPYRESD